MRRETRDFAAQKLQVGRLYSQLCQRQQTSLYHFCARKLLHTSASALIKYLHIYN